MTKESSTICARSNCASMKVQRQSARCGAVPLHALQNEYLARLSATYDVGLLYGDRQLFALSDVDTGSSACPNVFPKSCSLSRFGEGLGVRSFIGDKDPRGNGIFAGIVRSPSSSLAHSYFGLASRERDPLLGGFKLAFCLGYGWCRYQLLPALCVGQAGGDHGDSDVDSAPASESSDLNPECCDGSAKSGERFSLCSKSSKDADSDG